MMLWHRYWKSKNPVTRKLRIYSKSTINIGRQWCTQMSSEIWVDISDFLGLKKGEMTDYDYGDKKLMIANIGGTFYASDRVCTHAYVDLTGGILNESKKTVTCPLHLSSFDMSNGDALNLPAEEALKIYKIKKEKNKLFIQL